MNEGKTHDMIRRTTTTHAPVKGLMPKFRFLAASSAGVLVLLEKKKKHRRSTTATRQQITGPYVCKTRKQRELQPQPQVGDGTRSDGGRREGGGKLPGTAVYPKMSHRNARYNIATRKYRGADVKARYLGSN